MKKSLKATYLATILLALFVGELIYVLLPIGAGKSAKFVNDLEALKRNTDQRTGGVTADKINLLMNKDSAKPFTYAVITTNMGTIEIELSKLTPNTTKNFGILANLEFYNGVRFHRVVKGILIQAGDPLTKNLNEKSSWGKGGPGYRFKDELSGNEQYSFGVVAMANVGPDTNGSQFFIITATPGYPLPPNYTVFGKVIKGVETINAIQNIKTDPSNTPIDDVIIQKVEAR